MPDDAPAYAERIEDPFVQIDDGGCHSLGLTQSGKLVAWGETPEKCPGVPELLEKLRIVAIAAGDERSWVLTGEGKVYWWGPDSSRFKEPYLVVEDPSLLELAASERHCIARSAQGKVLCFDANTKKNRGKVRVLANEGAVSIACGKDNAMALTQDGELLVWGQWNLHCGREQGYRIPGNEARGVFAGGDFQFMVLLESGAPLFTGGGLSESFKLPPGVQDEEIAQASVSKEGVLLISPQGRVRRWCVDRPDELRVPRYLRGKEVVKAILYPWGVMAITRGGDLLIWKDDEERLVSLPSKVQDAHIVDAAYSHWTFAAVSHEGELLVWDGQELESNGPEASGKDFVHVDACRWNLVARRKNHGMHAFGLEPPSPEDMPVEVQSQKMTRLASGEFSFFGLREDGEIYAWSRGGNDLCDVPRLVGRADTRVVDVCSSECHRHILAEMTPRYIAGSTCLAIAYEHQAAALSQMRV